MKLDKEPLGIAVQAALTHLIGVDLDESVVSALFLHAQLKCSEKARKRSRPRGVRRTLERKSREERVGNAKNIHRRQLSSKEMPHDLLLPAWIVDCLNPVHALQPLRRITP